MGYARRVDPTDLVVEAQRRQNQVDAVLDRFLSIAEIRASAVGPHSLTPRQTLERKSEAGKRTEFRPVIDAVLDRAR
ncbi:MAG: hypothetical protein JWQ64_2841 [Subtercola sp.]|nr:hypothetical protein [Subtercola sp.]